MQTSFYDRIKNNNEPYIIAEIGSNHNGDMNLAKELIKSAKDCGCDAVKFQSWSPTSLLCKEEFDRNQKYYDSPKKHFGSLKEMCEKYYLRKEQHYELVEYSKSVGIDFSSSPFSNEEVDLLNELDVPFFKVASMDVNYIEFLKYIARFNKPILLSTGMANLSEIEKAVKAIEGEGNNQIVILHCIAIYPPDYKDINLNNIKMLQQTFSYPIGFSDHTFGTAIPLASVALGSCVIEKHFTLDKDMPGWDHEISADPTEMKIIVNESKNIFHALGQTRRIVSLAEEEKKLKFRRSTVAKRDLNKGNIISLNDLDFKRPGTGISPDEAKYLIGRVIKNDIKYDQMIHLEDFL